MLEHESYVALFNFGFIIFCIVTMGAGVFVARESKTIDRFVAHLDIVGSILLALWVGAIAVSGIYDNAFQAFVYGGCVVGCFFGGTLLEFWESRQATSVADAVRGIAVESARQMGKMPTSH